MVAAFLLFGRWNAGTPLEIASTPVSAAHPDENARARRNNRPIVVSGWSQPSSGRITRSALSTSGSDPVAIWMNPNRHMPRIANMNR